MSDEIIFHHSPMSRGRVVHWMLEEIGCPYRHVVLDLEKGELNRPGFAGGSNS